LIHAFFVGVQSILDAVAVPVAADTGQPFSESRSSHIPCPHRYDRQRQGRR
jgi:hypothetical protein